MKQLEIQYFWPLTEQIALPLDYTKCNEYDEAKRAKMFSESVTLSINGATTWCTVSSSIEPSFTIDVDQTPITVVSKQKPNFIKRWIYKTLGMKWKAK